MAAAYMNALFSRVRERAEGDGPKEAFMSGYSLRYLGLRLHVISLPSQKVL